MRPTVAQYTTIAASATASATKATRPGPVARVSGGRNAKATAIRIAASPALKRKNFTPASRETEREREDDADAEMGEKQEEDHEENC